MIVEDQSAVLALLTQPATYPGSPPVERIDTHTASVFLAGDRAYKLKRAVRYDYLDFSSVERRRRYSEAEVALNRRSAPDLYLGVVAVTREPDGTLTLGGQGPPVDWVVVMRRFSQDALFDRLAERGALNVALMGPLGEAVARLHASAERRDDHGGYDGMAWVIDGNELGFAEHRTTLDPKMAERVTSLCRAEAMRHRDLLDGRRHHGFVRHCHGDLHLRNIVLIDGKPTLFDGVEFNDEIACTDVLYDLAFLLMDLQHRSLPVHANVVFNHYLAATDDLGGLNLLPLFLGCRAAIRAKTSATAASLQQDAAAAERLRGLAREYLEMAERLLCPPTPRLIAIGGFSGSGKSTLAARLAPDIGPPPGALVVRSDLIRKSIFGVPPTEHLGTGAYTKGVSQEVYDLIAARAARALESGYPVIADAVYANPPQRADIEDVARREGAPFAGLWLDAPRDVMASRIAARTEGASDATVAVMERQLSIGSSRVDWRHIDATGSVDDTERRARELLDGVLVRTARR